MMLIPIIKIKDNGYEDRKPRIVGTNSHDLLVIDEGSGGIQYHNLQCCEGTKKYPDCDETEGYSFVGVEPEDPLDCPYGVEIEMVTFEQLAEIVIKETEEGCKAQRAIRELCKKIEAKRQEEIKKNGLDVDDGTRNSSGIIF